ncbi:MAG TPA: hypothetical protein VGL38_00895 [bacterium]|jgi:hypothetical protein
MVKRTLWYVCLALILAFGATSVLQAAGTEKKEQKAPSAVSVKSVRKASKAQLAADADVAQKLHAYELYDRVKNGGSVTAAEKAEIARFVGEPSRGGSALDNVGGPDAYGYRYVDNVAPDTASYAWIELCGDANATNGPTGDDASASATIGFPFSFYGTAYTSCYVSTNGMLSFGGSNTAWNALDPTTTAPTYPYFAPFFVDMNTGQGTNGGCTSNGTAPWIRWETFGTAPNQYFVVEWRRMPEYTTGNLFSVEAILYPNGQMKVQYHQTDFMLPTLAARSWAISVDAPGANGLPYWFFNSSNNTTTGHAPAPGRVVWFYQAPGLMHDYSCTTIASPALQQFVGQTVSVTASVSNVGQTTEASPVKYQFNGGAIVSEATAALPQHGVENHTFATQITMPAVAGSYQLKVWTDLVGDLARGNDTASVNIVVRSCYNVDLGSGFVAVTGQANCGLGNTYSSTCLGNYDGGEDMTYKWTCLTEGDYLFRMDPHGTTYPGMLLSNHCPPDSQCVRDTMNSGAVVLSFCQHLMPGTYYIMIDTWPSPNCIPNFDFSIGDCGTGRCCYGDPTNPNCATNTNAACTALNGTWTMGITCATNPCPARPVNDNCTSVTPVSLPATFTGNVNNATHDCSLYSYGDGEVWHAFTTTQCSNVTVSYCNTNAAWNCFETILINGCPCASSVSSSTTDYTTCANGNITIRYNQLPAGTYYLPVEYSVSCNDTGAYSIDVSAIACPPPPPNDACANAIHLTGNVAALPFDNTTAMAASENTNCGMGHDIWYAWSTQCEVDVNMTTCGSLFDTKIAAFSTNSTYACPGATDAPIICNDDTSCGNNASAITFHAMPGNYLIQVGGWSTSIGSGVLTINTSVQCSCDSATQVTVYMNPNSAGHTWVHFNAPTTTGRYKIYESTVKNNDSDPRNNDPAFTLGGVVVATTPGLQMWQDTAAIGQYKNYVVLHDCAPVGRCCYGDVMTPSCAVDTRAECDALQGVWTANTDCSTPCPTPHLARCCYGDPTAPQCATNAHFQCNALGGAWDSLLTCEANPCPIRPANDLCTGATVMTGSGDYTGDNSGCVSAITPAFTCTTAGYFDVWYSFTPTNGGSDTVRTCTGTTYDTIVEVLTGSCGSFTSVACNDDYCTTQSQVAWTAVAGTTYYIRMASYYSTVSPSYQGPYTLTLVAQ